jgi:membrane protease YdiL (CAAX protease family)
MTVLITLFITLCATAAILNLGRITKHPGLRVSSREYINRQLLFQVLLFGVAMLFLGAVYLLNAHGLAHFFATGDIAAPAGEVVWLGIGEGESWLGVGASFTFFVTLATTLFVYMKFRKSGGRASQVLPYTLWIVLFALTNSFSEEVIFRLGIIVPLYGSVDRAFILLISALAFGVPHLGGMPNGVVGAMMAGFLGWLLAKSVVETSGIFWAWSIHFLQDVVIFTAFVMSEVKNALAVPGEERAATLS